MVRAIFNHSEHILFNAGLRILRLMKRFLCIVALTACHSVWADSRCDQKAASLESAEGIVEWSATDSQWQMAVPGDFFCYGDKIRVLKQRAALRLANDTLVRLRENSVVTLLPENRGFWVELLQGAAHFLSRTPEPLTVKAAYLNAAIDGTEFVVTADGQHNRVAVFEGDVHVFNDHGEVRLSEGTETSAAATTAPNPPRSIRLRDAAEWILHYPPLIIQSPAAANISSLINQERYADALKQLTQKNMTSEDAALAASLALVSGQTAEADRLLNIALQYNSHAADALALQALKILTAGDDQAALAQTTGLLQTNSENVSVLLAHAYTLQSQGKIEDALEVTRKALTLDSNSLFLLARTAELELSAGNTRAARKLIGRALKKAPNHSRLNTLAGFIALNRFANKEAQIHFRTAIARNYNEPLAHLGLALALIQKGKIEEGRAEMEMAVLLDPGSSLLRSYLGKTYAAQDKNDWADAQYQLAKSLDPNDPTPWFYQAHLKHGENKSGEALQLITTAIEKNDNRAVYRSQLLLDSDASARSANLANIYKSLGFTATATNTAALSVFDNPTDFAGHQALVTAYSKEPQAQIFRAQEALKTRLLSPIGAKELPVGAGEIGLQVYPWASPGKSGTHEYSYLFGQRGLSGSLSSTIGSQNAKSYEWLLQAIGQNVSISAGQYDYQTDGHRKNNDLNIQIDEANLHYQVSDTTKLFVQFLSSDEESGDLSNNPKSPLFREFLRKEKTSDRYLVGLSHRISKDAVAIITASKSQSNLASAETSIASTVTTQFTTESDQFEAIYIGRIHDYSFQVGGYLQKYELDGGATVSVKLPNSFEHHQVSPEWERSEYSSIYTSVSTPSNNLLRSTASIGITDITSTSPGFRFSRNTIDYKLGALLFPDSAIKLNLAHWKSTASRLPTHPSWGMTDPFYINTIEDVTYFTEQVSTAAKLYLIQDQHSTVSIDIRDSRFTENTIVVLPTETEKTLAHDKTDTQSYGINIEHQISSQVTLTASSTLYDSNLRPVFATDRVIGVRNFINATNLKFSYWRHASVISEFIYLQQKKLTQTQEDQPTDASSDQGLFANLIAEFSLKKPALDVRAGIYNLFNVQENFHHANLTLQSESIAPSQLMWPAERSAMLNITYSF